MDWGGVPWILALRHARRRFHGCGPHGCESGETRRAGAGAGAGLMSVGVCVERVSGPDASRPLSVIDRPRGEEEAAMTEALRLPIEVQAEEEEEEKQKRWRSLRCE